MGLSTTMGLDMPRAMLDVRRSGTWANRRERSVFKCTSLEVEHMSSRDSIQTKYVIMYANYIQL